MSLAGAVRSTPLDDFLNDSSSSTDTGELLHRIGLTGSLTGITLSIGLLVFLAYVHTGSRREVAILIRVVGAAGAVTAVGAAVELAGVASVGDLGWAEALTDGAGSAPMMRLLAGLLILLGLFDHSAPVDIEFDGEVEDDGAVGDTTVVRWIPAPASAFAMVGVVVGAVSFWFDGHTVTEGPRVVHAAVNLVHVTAGGLWFGGIVGLAIVGALRRGATGTTAPLLIRFSSLATLAVIAVALAGAAMTSMIVSGPGDLTSTDWGRTLLVKTAAVAIVVTVGGYNHFVVVPTLADDDSMASATSRARLTVRVEAVLLLGVAVLTVFLTTASTT